MIRGRFGGCVTQSAAMCMQTLLFPKDTACVSLVFYFSEDTKCTKGIEMAKFRLYWDYVSVIVLSFMALHLAKSFIV